MRAKSQKYQNDKEGAMANVYAIHDHVKQRGSPMSTHNKLVHLKDYIANHQAELKRIIRQYVLKFGLAHGNATESVTDDVMSSVTTEALNHVDRLQTVDNPLPWLLGIAVNVIRRERDKKSRLEQREPLIHDLFPTSTLNEYELIDQFIGIASESDTKRLEQHETLSAIFKQLNDDESELLKLAILYDLDSPQIAHKLGISAGAVRVRLHRTLKKVRHFWGVQ